MTRLAVTLAALACLAPQLCDAQATKGTQKRPPKKSASATTQKATHPLQLLLDEAYAALEKKDFTAAVAVLQKYLAEQPNDAVAQSQLGYAFTALGKNDEAIAAYRAAVAIDPKQPAAQLNLGVALLEQERFVDAVAPLRAAAELLPTQAQPRFLLGTALERSGKSAEAAQAYRDAVQLDAANADAQFALGRVQLNSGQHAEAEETFRRLLAAHADHESAQLGLAQALIAQQKLEPALPVLEAYAAKHPDHRETSQQLADLYFQLDRHDAALKAIENVERLAGSGPSAATQRFRANILLRQKKYDDAAKLLAAIAESQPGDAETHALLGRVHLERRDFPAAERELKAALQLAPQSNQTLKDLMSVYYLAQSYPAALAVQDELLKRETPVAAFWFIRATCYDKLMRKQEAVDAYEKFLQLDQGRSETQDFQARQRVRILRRELERNR